MAVKEARVPILHENTRSTPAHHASEPATLGRGATVVTSLVAGAAAGALAKTTIAPLDRTKINFQTSQTPYSWRAALEFIIRSARTEGILALWRGNSATMARIVPYAAIQFTAHEQWKRVLGVATPQAAQQNRLLHLVAGSLAGVTSQSATYPLDMARARMAVTNATEYRTLRAVFSRVAKEEGHRALYRGYPATILGVIPYAGVSFFTYDTLKQLYFDRFGGKPSAIANMCFGGAAGALAQTASYPLDIVRRRMQTARAKDGVCVCGTIPDTIRHVYSFKQWPTCVSAAAGVLTHPMTSHCERCLAYVIAAGALAQTASYPLDIVRRRMQTARAKDGVCVCGTIPDTIRHVYSSEGWRGFFKGLSMNWVKGPIAVGISFATYDAIRTMLRDIAGSLQS